MRVGVLALGVVSAVLPLCNTALADAGVETVTVTAEKRAQDVQDVPISMQVVSGAQLDLFHQDSLRSLQNALPNVYVEISPGNDSVFMRGFGSAATNFGFDPSVSLYIDGIYAGHGPQFMAPFFDLDRVEVLRGPQGALFGKNTAAGAISVVTALPTDSFEARATASYNFDLKGTEDFGYVSGPLADNLSARLAVKIVSEDGWVKNIATDTHDPRKADDLARLSLKYDATSNFDVVARIEYSHAQTDGDNSVTAPLTEPSSWSHTRDANSPFGHPEEDTIDAFNASVTADLRLGEGTLTSISGYSSFTADRWENAAADDPALYFPAFLEHFHQVSEEIRYLSPANEPFEYVIGAYVDNSIYDLTNLQKYVFGGGGQERTAFRQNGTSYSLYAQGTYHFSDSLRAIGSLRFSGTDKTGSAVQTIDFGHALAPPYTVHGKTSETEFDPSATLQYDIVPGVMLYATYGRGSKGGGFVSNSLFVTNADFAFRPERSTNYEAGIKTTFDDNRVVLDLSIYDTRFKNLQVSTYDSALATFITGNAASASSKGAEFQVEWLPIDNLDFKVVGAYTDAKYDNFPGATCLATETLAQCDPGNPASIAANNITGTPLPYTSRWSGDIQGHVREPVGSDLQVDLTADVALRSKFFNSADLSPVYGVQPGFAELNARLQLGNNEGVWNVALVGTNLTNQRVINLAGHWPFSPKGPDAFGEMEPTRSVSIEASYRF
jgi:iron complex outermembrane receptor protein